MRRFVIDPMDVDDDDGRLLGGKGAALARLGRHGFDVPPWCAVLPSAFDASVDSASRERWRSGHADGPCALDRAVRAELDAALSPIDGPFAVRSSAGGEDSAEHSFAGQLASFLDVPREDVAARVIDVWRSGFSERVLAYRAARGIDAPPPAPTVLVQRMARADVAGVAFAADPVSGRRDVAVVSAVRGSGERLVSGEADADTWHVDGDGRVRGERLSGEPTGLSAAQVAAIARLARRTSQVFAAPQDIEWVLEGERLWLVQSRPITTLQAPAEGALEIWDNSNIAESYGGITSPLTFTFARHAYEGVYREFCRVMGVREGLIADSDHVFSHMLGLIDGRVYYNLLNWYRLIALLPGYRLNRGFMEGMMGVRTRLPDELDRLVTPVAGGRIAEWLHVARSGIRLVRQLLRVDRTIAAFYLRLGRALAPPLRPLAEMRLDELVGQYRMLERELLRRWDAPIVNDFFAMVFFGLLRAATARWCPGASPGLHNDLLCDIGEVVSAEPARRLAAMGAIAARDETLVRRLCDEPLESARAAAHDDPVLGPELRRYLDAFGDRCLEELKLESPTLVDDPTSLLRSIGEIARRGTSTGATDAGSHSAAEHRREAERDALERLAGHPIRRALFRRILSQATARVRSRENLRFERTRVFGRVRRLMVEIGRRLADRGALDAADDVFLLEIDEVLGWSEGTATVTDLRALVDVRRREWERFRAAPAPPDRFSTRGPVASSPRVPDAHATPVPPHAETRHGLACRPGVVRGRACVIRDPRGARIGRGEILVAERTDPGWVLLFPMSSGILVERGSLLSHSAIVARELGIPAVVSVPGLTSWLASGDLVELDGGTGRVTRVERAGGDA